MLFVMPPVVRTTISARRVGDSDTPAGGSSQQSQHGVVAEAEAERSEALVLQRVEEQRRAGKGA